MTWRMLVVGFLPMLLICMTFGWFIVIGPRSAHIQMACVAAFICCFYCVFMGPVLIAMSGNFKTWNGPKR